MEQGKKLWAEPVFRHSCLSALVLCLVAHGYAYCSLTFFHDRYSYSLPVVFDSAVRAKWMAQFVDALTAFSYLPWLFGAWVIVFFALGVFFAAQTMRLRRPALIWLLSGLWITSTVVINAHFYWPHEMLAALPLGMASAWVWAQERLRLPVRVALSAVLVGCSMACYGAYTNAALCVVLIALLTGLLDGQGWKKVFWRGVEYVADFVGGMVIYYGVLRLFLHFQQLALNNYMNESRLLNGLAVSEFLSWAVTAYREALKYVIANPSFRVMMLLGGCLFFAQLLRARQHLKEPPAALLAAFLAGAFPLCAGSIYVLAFGAVHDLMTFTFWMPLVLVLVLAGREWDRLAGGASFAKSPRALAAALLNAAVFLAAAWAVCHCGESIRVTYCCIAAGAAVCLAVFGLTARWAGTEAKQAGRPGSALLVGLVLVCFGLEAYRGVLLANESYLWAAKVDERTRSAANRVLAQIEGCEGYTGSETVVFVGHIADNPYLNQLGSDEELRLRVRRPRAGSMLHGFTYNDLQLFRTVTAQPLELVFYSEGSFAEPENEQVRRMPLYPEDGSICRLGDRIVVKFAEPTP